MIWHLPFAIAHRGAPRLAPENTISALIGAKKQGAAAVECDIQLTKDYVPIILHDATLNRTSNGNGLLSRTSFKKIETLSAGKWFSKKFENEKMPTLREWLETASELNLMVNLEIKVRTEKQAKLLSEMVCAYIKKFYSKKLPAPLISSSNLFVVTHTSKNNKKARQGLITEKQINQKTTDILRKNNVVSIHQPYQLMTERYIYQLHQEKFCALAYTVNDLKLAKMLKKNGIDGIFTDNHHLFNF